MVLMEINEALVMRGILDIQ